MGKRINFSAKASMSALGMISEIMRDKPAGLAILGRWRVRVKDPVKGVVYDSGFKAMHSVVRNFGFFVRGFLSNIDLVNETLTDDAGVSFQVRLKSPAGTGGGVIVGTPALMKFGNSALALDSTQTNIQGAQLDGNGSVTTALVVEDSVNTIFTCKGQVTNSSGSAFTVEEIALFASLNDNLAANHTTMMARDLTGPVVVNDGQTIEGEYEFTIAV